MTVSNANLELDHINLNLIRSLVSYTVVFTPFERHLAALGMLYRQEIAILASDFEEVFLPPGSPLPPPPPALVNYPNQILNVTDGDVDLVLSFTRPLNIAHGILHAEDSTGADEVQARVTVRPIGFFAVGGSSDFSPVENVPGFP